MEHISVVKLTTGCGKKQGFSFNETIGHKASFNTFMCYFAVVVAAAAAVAAAAVVVAVVLNNLNFSARSLSHFIASCMAYLD